MFCTKKQSTIELIKFTKFGQRFLSVGTYAKSFASHVSLLLLFHKQMFQNSI